MSFVRSSSKTLTMYLILLIIGLTLSYGFQDISNVKSVRGVVKHTTGGRIIGGNETSPNEFPYQVGLFINNHNAFCGGALISNNYVLTAAHCAEVMNQVEAILGAHNLTRDESTQIKVLGSDIKVHEDYDNTYRNDIALIKLSHPVTFNDFMQPIQLPRRSDAGKNFDGLYVNSTGWGMVEDKSFATMNDMSDVLRVVSVPIMSVTICGDYYNDPDLGEIYIDDTNLCTSGYRNKGTCNGDSGGPLVYEGTQIGLVSFGTDLCEECSPSAYTRIDSHLDWIEKNSDVIIQQ